MPYIPRPQPGSTRKAPPPLSYGPYHTRAQALVCIGQYLMSAYTDGTGFAKGIVWVEGNQVDVLREPLYVQATGLGDTVAVEWHGISKRPADRRP